jgi:hypothetical protein
MQEFLTDLEIVEIERFCSNEVMFNAVKKVLLQHIYSQGVITKGLPHNPLKNRALVLVGGDINNEELGSQLRSLWEGINALETGFTDLEKIKSKKTEQVESQYNEAI